MTTAATQALIEENTITEAGALIDKLARPIYVYRAGRAMMTADDEGQAKGARTRTLNAATELLAILEEHFGS